MADQSNRQNRRIDENLKHETQGLEKGNRQTRAEEWRQVEPSGEDQPDVDLVPHGSGVGGTPPGMDEDDVEGRSEFAAAIGSTHYPAKRDDLIDRALDQQAPDWVIGMIRRLPPDREFTNLNDVWTELGGHAETQRF